MSYEQQRDFIFQKLRNGSENNFEELALEIFRFQSVWNPLYAQYLALLGVDCHQVKDLAGIPFLPIQFFKTHEIKSGNWLEETVFTSSATTGMTSARHLVRSLDFYKENTVAGFQKFYGSPADYCILALLPSYLERSGSSLVCMADHFIHLSGQKMSGFFLRDTERLVEALRQTKSAGQPVLLLGVSFALLELSEQYPIDLQHVIIMETGGMKGRRKELTREELHGALKSTFGVSDIHSEYGMAELFSQAYSKGKGVFTPTPTMRVFAREISDPLSLLPPDKTGILNIIDLANFDTCAFIATEDLGRVGENGDFEVLGRVDNSDIRGCNLMVY